MSTQELTTGTQGTRMNTQELIAESQKWLDIISSKELSQEQRDKIEHDTVDNFSFYYNRGYLEYRKSVIEMRESPALDIIRLLEGQGAKVSYHDPHVPVFKEDGHEMRSVPFSAEALRAADCVMVVTDHTAIDYQLVKKHSALVVDTRNALARRN